MTVLLQPVNALWPEAFAKLVESEAAYHTQLGLSGTKQSSPGEVHGQHGLLVFITPLTSF